MVAFIYSNIKCTVFGTLSPNLLDLLFYHLKKKKFILQSCTHVNSKHLCVSESYRSPKQAVKIKTPIVTNRQIEKKTKKNKQTID